MTKCMQKIYPLFIIIIGSEWTFRAGHRRCIRSKNWWSSDFSASFEYWLIFRALIKLSSYEIKKKMLVYSNVSCYSKRQYHFHAMSFPCFYSSLQTVCFINMIVLWNWKSIASANKSSNLIDYEIVIITINEMLPALEIDRIKSTRLLKIPLKICKYFIKMSLPLSILC